MVRFPFGILSKVKNKVSFLDVQCLNRINSNEEKLHCIDDKRHQEIPLNLEWYLVPPSHTKAEKILQEYLLAKNEDLFFKQR